MPHKNHISPQATLDTFKEGKPSFRNSYAADSPSGPPPKNDAQAREKRPCGGITAGISIENSAEANAYISPLQPIEIIVTFFNHSVKTESAGIARLPPWLIFKRELTSILKQVYNVGDNILQT